MNADTKFVGLVRDWLCNLPTDLKVAYDAMDNEDLSPELRELAVGAIIYVITPNPLVIDVNERSIGFTGDAIVMRLALVQLFKLAGEDGESLRERYSEQFADLEAELKLVEQSIGDLYPWLAAKVDGLRGLEYKGKKVKKYVDDDDARELLFEEGLVFRTNYPVDEDTIADKLKKVSTIVDVMGRRRAEEIRLSSL